ncbi:unnamed protein product [Allacma fusca]|uniref:Uncharacterized protein n=1 Tax=Allacma fusca TaxID=39272 RepID=A0A8J2LLN4_9HEXA|nr:unnamed protein product [Allacma fusca]
MMKLVIIVSVIAAASAQLRTQPEVQVIQDVREINEDGSFRYISELSDGTRAESAGYIKNPNAPEDERIQSVSGAYSHYSPEGEYLTVTYTADENGFQPQGAHLPTPPPIPEAIQRALDIIYRNAGLPQPNTPPRPQIFRSPIPPRRAGK